MLALSSRIPQFRPFQKKTRFGMPCSGMGPFLAIATEEPGGHGPGRRREIRCPFQAGRIARLNQRRGGFKAPRWRRPKKGRFVDLPCKVTGAGRAPAK